MEMLKNRKKKRRMKITFFIPIYFDFLKIYPTHLCLSQTFPINDEYLTELDDSLFSQNM